MSLLSRKGLLAVTAVLNVALHTDDPPVASRALAHRHRLPPRHLESVLQALVRAGILKGIRGPRGGYQLARDPRQITADDILRAIGTIEEQEEVAAAKSRLLAHVEGIVSNRRDAPYRSGRSKTRLKIMNLPAPGVLRFEDRDASA
jgi:Rrf2 family protein